MRIVARLKLGYYPLPVEQGPMLRARLAIPKHPPPLSIRAVAPGPHSTL